MGETTERGGASYVEQRMRTLNIVYERCEKTGGMAATEDKTKQQVNSISRYNYSNISSKTEISLSIYLP